MRLDNQVVSLELSKRLKELGVKQESYFAWDFWAKPFVTLFPNYLKDHPDNQLDRIIAAFTVAELGEMLPTEVHGGFIEYWKKYWEGGIKHMVSCKIIGTLSALTEADARAKLLIYLIEKGIVKP